jgi:hypothetical protein
MYISGSTVQSSVLQLRTIASLSKAMEDNSDFQELKTAVDTYTANVRKNIEKDGLGKTLSATGGCAFLGGLLGGATGIFASAMFPDPVSTAVLTGCTVVGLTYGALHRLGRETA